MLRFLFAMSLIIFLVSLATGLTVGMYYYYRFTRDLPKLEKISDYRPNAVSSIYAVDGALIGEAYEERRYPVPISEIPQLIKNAFLAAEDANFYQHPGIDVISIFRAAWVNFRQKSFAQGASTITQQVVKSLLLTKEKTFERKVKEAILAYKIEEALTKDEIFSIYLNEIYLGSHAYGIKAAAKVHFHKNLSEVTIAEAAFLAALPKKPGALSRPENRADAFQRQKYVLSRMLVNKMISPVEKAAAEQEEVTIYPPNNQKIFHAPYFVSHVLTLLENIPVDKNKTVLSGVGGYEIHTTVDLPGNDLAQQALQRGLREIDKRRGWRGPLLALDKKTLPLLLQKLHGVDASSISIPENVSDDLLRAYWIDCSTRMLVSVCPRSVDELKPNEIFRALVREKKGPVARIQVGQTVGTVDLSKATWANKFLGKNERGVGINIQQFIMPGHVIEVSLQKSPAAPSAELVFELDQTPDLEGAFVVANVLTGMVQAIVGGYDYRRSVFNRATQGMRQPGSSFKPFIYLSALDNLHYTPSTIVPDSPISMMGGDGQLWSPGNFDHKFLGPIPLRTALQRSRNVVSVYLLRAMGVDRAIEAARKLGITTPIPREMSISLGTAEVTLIELIRAYGTFAAGGWLSDTLVITQIKDRDGKVVYQKRPRQEKVISEETAFIMANMMKGVVERGTATVVNKLGRPVGGKTGTTNEHMDAWFIGFTPEWVGGVWVGFDQKKMIGRMETGGKAAAPIFVYFMEEFLKDTPILDFDIPDGVVPVLVNRNSGRPTSPDDPNAFYEYFKIGTEPQGAIPQDGVESPDSVTPSGKDYLSSDEF